MTPLQLVVGHTSNALLALTLVGILLRGKQVQCLSFAGYLLLVLIPSLLIGASPERFYRFDFWLLTEMVHNIAKLVVVLELTARMFRGFPGAQATAQRGVLLVLGLTYAAVLLEVSRGPTLRELATDAPSSLLNGICWLYLALAGVVLWHRLPIRALHRAIVFGFASYMVVSSYALTLISRSGWELRQQAVHLSGLAWLSLMAYWTHAAWRADPAPAWTQAVGQEDVLGRARLLGPAPRPGATRS
jgi:hypothetical protein